MAWASFLTDVFAQLVVILYPGVFVYWLIVHTNIARLRAARIKAEWIAAFAWVVTAGPLIYFRREIFQWRWPMPFWIASGLVAFIMALTFGRAASRHIPLRTLIGLAEIEPQKNKQIMLESGVYGRTRNPIYFAHILLVFSAAALSGFAANWIMLGLDVIVLPFLILAEERELLDRFGPAYAAYMKRVPRFFPRLR